MSGEILGIAGMAGCGQKELLRGHRGPAILRSAGAIALYPGRDDGMPLRRTSLGMRPDAIKKTGVAMAFVPEDRLGMGLVGSHGHDGQHDARSS